MGRSAIAPQLLLALWLYATLQGVGSARQLSRLVLEHDAYRWISGGVQVNHHSLSDFRVAHGAALDELLSTSVPVRGRAKVRCVALLFALAHNLMRTLTLVPALLGLGPTASACSAATA